MQVLTGDGKEPQTLSQMLADYEKRLRRSGGPKYVSTTMSAIRRILDGIGAEVVSDVTVDQVDDCLDRLGSSGSSPGTLNHYRGYIRGFFRWAEDTDRIVKSPLRGLRPRSGPRARRRHANTPAEIGLVLDAARYGRPYEQPAYTICYGAGLRQNEVLRLRWGDLDLEGGLYSLIDARQKNRQDTVTPLLPELVDFLRRLKAARERDLGRPVQEVELVITGAPTRGGSLAADRRATVERAGLAYRGLNGEVNDWHAMRHTFVTMLGRRADIDMRTKQMLARHANIQTTALYDHSDLNRQRRALALMPRYLGQAA